MNLLNWMKQKMKVRGEPVPQRVIIDEEVAPERVEQLASLLKLDPARRRAPISRTARSIRRGGAAAGRKGGFRSYAGARPTKAKNPVRLAGGDPAVLAFAPLSSNEKRRRGIYRKGA